MKTSRLFQGTAGQIRTVRSGFNWFACILGSLWAFGNRGWVLGLLLTAGSVALVAIEVLWKTNFGGMAAELGTLALYLGYMYACGRYGNEWLARTLRWQGYRELRNDSRTEVTGGSAAV